MGLVARSGYSKSASADLTLASKRQNGQSRGEVSLSVLIPIETPDYFIKSV
jgi:hypothetical protein